MNSRLAGIRASFKGIDGFLVTDINNVRYFTGFRGSSGFLLITKTANFLLLTSDIKSRQGARLRDGILLLRKKKSQEPCLRLPKSLG